MKRIDIKNLILCGIFTAIIAALSQLSFPTLFGVPLTLQTFALALCGYTLGFKYGLASCICYLSLGAVGAPVFANFKGTSALIGITGGFLWGFLFLVSLCGLGIKNKNKIISILLGIAGLLICHILGVIQFSLVSGSTIIKSLITVSAPFLIKDILSVVVAFFISITLKKAILSLHK